ncbi:MAG: zinc ABC transporter substrate-binding protein [Phycisphaerales bacterium]|nr:zinc ABC transporter substrate-binding protein [Phycisphaerales bacterium]
MTCSSGCNGRLGARRLLSFVAMVGATFGAAAYGEVRVVTTTPAFADIVRNVGGTHVSVESVMRGPEDVHSVSPRPSQMMLLKRAALFVHAGLDGEPWAPLLVKGARNPNLLPGATGNVDVSAGIVLKEVPSRAQMTRALGDIHAFGNTHYALDPLNGVIIARTVAEALKGVDAGNAGEYESNCLQYEGRLRAMTARLVEAMRPYAGARVVTYHRSWPYFLDRFGLVSIGEVEPKPGISPGPRHFSECVEKMNAQNARVVIVEAFNPLENAEAVASRVGGRAVVMAQDVKALPGVDSYESLFEHNVGKLIEAFKAVGTGE